MKNIVTLTSIPGRIPFLHKLEKSLKVQALKPDAVEIYLPHTYSKRSLGQFDISQVPSSFDVVRCDDIGPATKILPAVSRHKNRGVRLIYCDDDRIYHQSWLQRLARLSDGNPEKCVADEVNSVPSRINERNWRLRPLEYRLRRMLALGRWRPLRVDRTYHANIAEGFGGVLVRPEFFTDRVFDIPAVAWTVDDIWLSANLNSNGVDIRYTQRERAVKSAPVIVDGEDLGRSEDSLVNFSDGDADRIEADYQTIRYAIQHLGCWKKYERLLGEEQRSRASLKASSAKSIQQTVS